MIKLPDGFSWAEEIRLGSAEVYRLSKASWPRFLLEDSDIPDPILKFQLSARDFKERFKVFGIRQTSSGLLVGFLQAVHVEIDLASLELPDLGWRFSIQNAATRSKKNALSLVEASIDPAFRGRGLSKFLIERAKQEARESGFTVVVAPVRPTLKSRFPDEPLEAYCARRDAQGRLLDPWLRVHAEAGAEMLNVCTQSAQVKASLAKWRAWTGLPLTESGPHWPSGALAPVTVDVNENHGLYTEANVWMRYVVEPSPGRGC